MIMAKVKGQRANVKGQEPLSGRCRRNDGLPGAEILLPVGIVYASPVCGTAHAPWGQESGLTAQVIIYSNWP